MSSQRSRVHARAEQATGRYNEYERIDRHTLQKFGFTNGLIDAAMDNRNIIQHTFVILDNSPSMTLPDGNCCSQVSGQVRFLQCSRLEELKDAAMVHVSLAVAISAPTTFRFLNHPGPNVGEQVFTIASTPESSTKEQDVAIAQTSIQRVKARGSTPLTEHVKVLRSAIEPMNNDLTVTGKRVAVVIATDGIPTDDDGMATLGARQEFMSEFNALRRLKVIVVVRLCTDDTDVVEFWNRFESNVEAPLDVLDDYVSEAKEVYAKNPWLTYGMPLHRLREMGFEDTLLDKLDEDSFALSDVCGFLRILFGNVAFPDPITNWKMFSLQIEEYLKAEEPQYNPIHRKMMPWIDMKALRRKYRPSGWMRM